jgi:hypothetical protein
MLGDAPCVEANRIADAGQVDAERFGGREVECAAAVAPVEEIGRRWRLVDALGLIPLPQRDDAVRVAIRQRPQQDAVHHAEDRRRRTDAQGERRYDNERKGRLADQPARREPRFSQPDAGELRRRLAHNDRGIDGDGLAIRGAPHPLEQARDGDVEEARRARTRQRGGSMRAPDRPAAIGKGLGHRGAVAAAK